MTSYNYKFLKGRRKAEIVNDHMDLPPGNWRSVAEAARIKNRSRQTIYLRFFKGRCRGFRVGISGELLVNIDEIF